MRQFLVPALAAAMALGVAATAQAQPSFNCNVQLNPTEQAICDNAELSAMDREMASKYFAIFDRLSGERQIRLRREQSLWRRNRDACGRAVGCIYANYFLRIAQLTGPTPLPGASGPPPAGPEGLTRAANTRVLPDGTIEKILPDGERVLYRVSGEIEHYPPDGEPYVQRFQFAQVPILTPPLSEYGAWVNGLTGRLLGILENVLTDDEYAAYLSTESGRDQYGLLEWRLSFISRMTEP